MLMAYILGRGIAGMIKVVNVVSFFFSFFLFFSFFFENYGDTSIIHTHSHSVSYTLCRVIGVMVLRTGC